MMHGQENMKLLKRICRYGEVERYRSQVHLLVFQSKAKLDFCW